MEMKRGWVSTLGRLVVAIGLTSSTAWGAVNNGFETDYLYAANNPGNSGTGALEFIREMTAARSGIFFPMDQTGRH